MKSNQDKCHLLVSGHKHETIWAKIGEMKSEKVINKNCLVLLLIEI